MYLQSLQPSNLELFAVISFLLSNNVQKKICGSHKYRGSFQLLGFVFGRFSKPCQRIEYNFFLVSKLVYFSNVL